MTTAPLYVVVGAVVDVEGRPVAGARLALVRGPEPLPGIAVRSDAAGAFALAALTPGAYELECRAAGRAPLRQAITLTPAGGHWARVALRLPDPLETSRRIAWPPMPKILPAGRLSE